MANDYSNLGLNSQLLAEDGPAARPLETVSNFDFSNNYDRGILTQTQMGSAVVGTAQIVDLSITTAKLAESAVITSKMGTSSVDSTILQDLAVTAGKIGGSAVTDTKIAINAVGSVEIEDDAVGSLQLGNLAVDTIHVNAAAIGSTEMQLLSVGEAQMGLLAVGSAQIQAVSIGSAEIGLAAIYAAAIQTAAVGSAAIGTAVIQNVHMGTASILNAQIGTAAIGTANIGTLSFNEITGGTANLGGTLSGDGVLSVKDEGDTERVLLNKDGIKVTGGSIVVEDSGGGTIIDSVGLVSSANFSIESNTDATGRSTTTVLPGTDMGTASVAVITSKNNTRVLLTGHWVGYSSQDAGIGIVYFDVNGTEVNSPNSRIWFNGLWNNTAELFNGGGYGLTTTHIIPSAGTHTVKLKVASNNAANTINYEDVEVIVLVLGK